jgi:hypothetical protein
MTACKYLLILIAAATLSGCATPQRTADDQMLAAMSCETHKNVADALNAFAVHNFEKSYTNDYMGAMAQLFLIQTKGPGDYSLHFNRAEGKYRANPAAAQTKGCDTSVYPLSPITEFERRTNRLKTAQAR